MGDGKEAENLGKAMSLTVTICNREIDFGVLPRERFALIGRNWFRLNRAYVKMHSPSPVLCFEDPEEQFTLGGDDRQSHIDSSGLFQLDLEEPYLMDLVDSIVSYESAQTALTDDDFNENELDATLTESQKSQVRNLIRENSDVFANSISV